MLRNNSVDRFSKVKHKKKISLNFRKKFLSNPATQNKILCPKCKKLSPHSSTKSTNNMLNMLIDSNIIKEKIRLQSKIIKDFSLFQNLISNHLNIDK